MTKKISRSWRGILPGDKYASNWPVGRVVPDNYVDFFEEEGVLHEVDDVPNTEDGSDTWSEQELKKANGETLRQIVADDPDFTIDGIDKLMVKDLRTAVLTHYFPS